MIQIPLDGQADTIFKHRLRQPAQLVVDLGRIDGIAHIVSFSVLHMLDQALRLTEIFTDEFHDIDIFHLVVSADVVDFADGSVAQDQINRLTVILDIQPVAHIESLSVYRKRLICQRICDHKWNEFFRKLVWSVVVRAAADRHRQSIGSVVCHDKQIRRCLGGAVRAGGMDRGILMEEQIRAIQWQITVHLIRGHLMIT